MHRAACDRVDRAVFRAGVALQPAFEHADDGRFAATDRAHQEEDSLAHLQALGGGLKVFDQLIERRFDSEDLTVEERVVVLAVLFGLDARRGDHVEHAGVGETAEARILPHQVEVVGERPGPGEALVFRAERFKSLTKVDCHGSTPFPGKLRMCLDGLGREAVGGS